MAAAMGDGSPDRISQIMEQRRDMKRAAARLAADFRNEDRKRVRLLEKAARLSDQDLQAIMLKRGRAKAKAEAKAAAKSKAKQKKLHSTADMHSVGSILM